MAEKDIAPIRAAERISEIDIARGLALFGILMVNMSFFKMPVMLDRFPSSHPAGFDQMAAWIIQLLFTGKFYAIFSFLFGLGFYIFMERTLDKGLELVPLYRRRLLALLLFGFVHLFILWSGDILFTYAITGFFLLAFRNKSIEAIRKWIISLFFVSFILNGLFMFFKTAGKVMAPKEYEAIMSEMVASAFKVYTEGSFTELVAFRLANEVPYVIFGLIAWIPAVLAFFLCGLYIGKKGIFKDLPGHAVYLKRVRNVGFPVGGIFLLLMVFIGTGIWPVHPLIKHSIFESFNYLASLFIFPAYVAALLLFLQGEKGKRILAPIAATGRMALTNYLAQTVICIFIFYGFGLSLYGQVSIIAGIIITISIYLVQVVWSNLWMKKFYYGPMEWLWRVMTYKNVQLFVIRKK